MLKAVYILFLSCSCAFLTSCSSFVKPSSLEGDLYGKRILLFTKTNKFRHQSIEDAVIAFEQLANTYQFTTFATEDSAYFTATNLANYDAVIFISTTGILFDQAQRKAFKSFIQQGGGFMGIHGSSWCELDWPWFVKLVGGTFHSHSTVQQGKLTNISSNHVKHHTLPTTFNFVDEWYNFHGLNPERIDILSIDESSYQGKKTHGEHHPIAWYQAYDGGRSFYTSLGHNGEAFYHPLMQKHLLAGLAYVSNKTD